MKIAIAGKGGVGKTTLTARLGNTLALCGQDVWLVDADTATSLGQACGLSNDQLPLPLAAQRELLHQRTTMGEASLLSLTPKVNDLPEALSVALPVIGHDPRFTQVGKKNLLLMGGLHHAGGGCACEANALLKALLAHLVLERKEWVLVDLEAGVEHLGRGTVASVDQLIIVAEPSKHSLGIAAQVGLMAAEMGLNKQVLVLNRATAKDVEVLSTLNIQGLPKTCINISPCTKLMEQRLTSTSVLGLDPATDMEVHEQILKLLKACDMPL